MRILTFKNGDQAREAWAALVLFAFPALSMVTHHGIGLAGFLFLGSALYWWRDSWQALVSCWPEVRWVVLAFALHLGFTLLFAGSGKGVQELDAPGRMLLTLSAMLFVLVARPGPMALWAGVVTGVLAAFCLVAWQRLIIGDERAGGFMNPITFGDLALCLALLALASGCGRPSPGAAAGAAVGVVAGLAASMLTGSRGGWIAVPVAIALLASERQLMSRRLALLLATLVCLLLALAWAIPATGVRGRIGVGISDVLLYWNGNRIATSLSVRLELWKAALMLIGEHPLAGLDTQAYKSQMRTWVALGQLHPSVFAPPEPPHMHNDALQMLVTRGVPGFVAWVGTLLAPLLFFRRHLQRARSGSAHYAAALGGLLVVLAYICFGLTETIFWSMRASLFYAQMVFLLMGFCLLAREVPEPAPAACPAEQARQDSLPRDRPSHRPARAEK